MKRIMVVGVSAGVGKSTFSKELGEKLRLPVHHLDAYYWKAGWVETEDEAFRTVTRSLAEQDSWIIDGNYSMSFEERMQRADTMIYLELPLRVCLYRVLKRYVTNIGHTRPDMAEGCTEKMDSQFLLFIWRTYGPRKTKMRERLRRFETLKTGNRSVLLTNKRQIAEYLKKTGK